MIEFVTLLLGLVTGTQAVELSVSEQVALVEVRLDGSFVGGLRSAPWFLNCDFGEELMPHELSAIAYDAQRRELQTIRQWINLPRQRTEARLVLSRDGDAPPTARLIWTALDHQGTPQVRLTFDGQPLAAGDLEAIALPPHDLKNVHLLRAELAFSEGDQAHAELVFGGTFGDQVATELTALVFAAGKRPPSPEKMGGWLRKGDRKLEVVAVDRGPLNLLVVRERSAATLGGLKRIFDEYQTALVKPGRVSLRQPVQPGPVTPSKVLDPGDRARFAFPTTGREQTRVGQGAAPITIEQVPVSRNAMGAGGRLFDVLTNAFWSEEEAPAARHQLADAVAIAGVVAATGDHRRAVLLIRSGVAEDSSRFSPRQVRSYLRRLGVPLFVWSIDADDAPSAWGDERDVSNYKRMTKALADLRKALKPQVVVWVEGSHLSHRIELTEKVSGLKRVG